MKMKIYSMLMLIAVMVMASLMTKAQPIGGPEFGTPGPGEITSGASAYVILGEPVVGIGLITFTNSTFADFTVTTLPPASTPGAFTITTVPFTFTSTVTYGGPPFQVSVPSTIEIKVTYDHTTGTTNYYDNEILSLDISGGNLPAGVMLRESPTMASVGQATIRPYGGGNYGVSCAFNIFLEGSTDGGTSWNPDVNAPVDFTLQSEPFTTNSSNQPAVGGTYKDPGTFVQAAGWLDYALECIIYIGSVPPPPSTPGAFVIINASSNTQSYLSNGGPATLVTAPATMVIKVTYNHTTGTTRYFDTEMLALSISGGTLPPGVQFRESPTQPSPGKTTITDIGGGQFQIHSFFDIFTELSTDGGSSWNPSTAQPSHRELQGNSSNSIPTLSEWGLIGLGILVLGVGILFVRRVI